MLRSDQASLIDVRPAWLSFVLGEFTRSLPLNTLLHAIVLAYGKAVRCQRVLTPRTGMYFSI